MPRIRTIKPGFFANEGLSEVSEAAQILAGGLLCYADDEGYFNAHPALVKAAVFPLRRHITEDHVSNLLAELAIIGYVRFGKGRDGKRYGFILNFAEHQKVSHPVASKIKYLEIIWEVSGTAPDNSVKPPEPLRPELNGIEKELKGKEEKPSARKTRGVNNTQVAKASGETRHARLQQIVTGFYQEWAGAECPWDGGEGRNLKRMLDSTPNWPDTQFVTCLDNLAASECVPKGSRPRDWLEQLPRFLRGPLDRYWKPKQGNGNGNGDRKTAAAARTARNLEVLLPQRMGEGVPRVHVPDVGAVQPRADGSGERTHGRVTDGETVARKPPIIDAAPNS